ncbi:RNA-directed DNA polymerase, eukaryota, reverse transcriptase zinc-binding domain protein [Tanacetum coccineum]
MINGLMVDGTWITDPSTIKDALLQFYKVKFQAQDSHIVFPNLPFSQTLNCRDRDNLERQVTLEEIKEAIWDCGSSKAPGRDGYTFAFVKKIWGTIQKDTHEFVNYFFVSNTMPSGGNSSFFTLIPKVNNPTFINDFRPISLIGIHYKIIAKILANRLAKVIDKIVSKEQSAFITSRQILDGPLILSEIIECSVSVKIGALRLNLALSLLEPLSLLTMTLLLLQSGTPELDNIIRVLHIFYLVSGLKINIHKSNIYGIGVNEEEVSFMANNAGCISGILPFTYLGLLIGSNMKSIASWKTVIDRFQLRLSSWKANLLSIGGSLDSYQGSTQDIKKMTWVKWPNILASFEKGGLNIDSLKAFNLALLQNGDGGCSPPEILYGLRYKAGYGTKSLWKDIWLETPLCSRYNRLYRLDLDKDCLIINKIDNGNWNWNWFRTNLGTRNLAYFRDLLIDCDVTLILAEDNHAPDHRL